ncbi:MAG TPA: cadherin-like domain-containing protein [Vicinamibacterales bacterium]|nr:cadherin-like domain-containing protein [Vicinamibacterales bacterium]
MFAPSKIKVGARAVALALALATSSFSAHAILARTGPVSIDPSIGGFPAWYQDTTGLALEFCAPQNAAELSGGWCLLLPGTVGAVPETFPTNFVIEHFDFDANAKLTTRSGSRALMVLAQEASFTNGAVVIPGQQFTFSRIRLTMTTAPATGTYRFIHPYGEDSVTVNIGDKIFFTNDVGLGCGLNFDCALNGRMGPWLLPSATPGGVEMPALTAANPIPDPAHTAAPTPYPGTGASYIADPARIGPVTGSPLPNFIDSTGASRNHNIFRIEGPAGSGLGVDPLTGAVVDWIETTNISLAGRVFTGTVPGKFTVNRASYTHTAAGQKLDVFATATPATASRIPAAPVLAPIPQTLSYFAAPCAGTLDPLTGAILPPFSAPLGAVQMPMKAAGSLQWAQTQIVAPAVVPASVCVEDASATNAAGAVVPQFVPQIVTDEVGVTPAFYDPAVGTLTVGATSSDTVLPPTLTLAYGTFIGDMVAGSITVPGLLAPPANILAESSHLGITKYNVSTGFVAAATAGIPTATNDTFSFPMNSAPQVLNVLANDANAVGGTVTITSAPVLGTAVVNANGTITFTPNLNASGADAFTYTVTIGTQVSNAAVVSLNITPVNLAPTAVNDAFNAIAGHARTFNLLANDTDPNGLADIRFAQIVTAPAGATATVTGGTVTFTAATAGTYTFTYRAVDAGGLASANIATVTVTVAATESLLWTKNFYTVAQSKLVAAGTITPIADQTVRVDFVSSAGVVLGTAGTVAVDALGGFLLQITPIALPTGTVSIKATTSNGTVQAIGLVIK